MYDVVDFKNDISIVEPIEIRSNTIYENVNIINGNLGSIFSFFRGYGSLNFGLTVDMNLSHKNKIVFSDQSDYSTYIKKHLVEYGPKIHLYFKSEEKYSELDSGMHGFWAVLESVDYDKKELYIDRLPKFLMKSYKVYFPRLIENVVFRNVNLIGTTKFAVRLYLAKNITFENMTFHGNTYTGLSLESIIHSRVYGCIGSKGDHKTGAAYGVAVVGGCSDIDVSGGSYSDYRHGVSVGGTEATSDRITIRGVTASSCSDAGIDVHPNCDSVIISENIVDINSSVEDQTGDGICVQNTNSIITSNIIKNPKREAILIQPCTIEESNHIVSSNIIHKNSRILVDKYSSSKLNIDISSNILDGGYCLIQGYSPERGDIKGSIVGRHRLIIDRRNANIDIKHQVDAFTEIK